KIVPGEKSRAPTVGVASHRSVLCNVGRQAHQEQGNPGNGDIRVGHAIPDHGVVECKYAVVVQKRRLNVLAQGFLGPESQRVPAVGKADNVPHRIEICPGHWSSDSARRGKGNGTSHGDLWQRMWPLDGKLRAQVAQRNPWQVLPPAKIARIAQPCLIEQVGADRPGVAEVQVLLTPVELLYVPRDVAVGLACDGIGWRNGIVSAGVEVTSTQPLAAAEVVVDPREEFIGVVRTASHRLIGGSAAGWDVGKSGRSEQFPCRGIQERWANRGCGPGYGRASILAW